MNKRGNTLIEVIVSFVIVSIITFSLVSVYTSSKKINRHNALKENVIEEVGNIFTVFSSDPSAFNKNIVAAYPECVVNTKENTETGHNDYIFTLYYDGRFVGKTTESDNYLMATLVQTNRKNGSGYLYTLTIDTYVNKAKEEKINSFSRSVIDLDSVIA